MKQMISEEGFAAWQEFRKDMEQSKVWKFTHNDGRRLAFMAFCNSWNKAKGVVCQK